MPKDQPTEDGAPQDEVPQVDYHFVLRSLTLRDLSKDPGPVQYSSREHGVPYATFDVDWSGAVWVPLSDDPLENLRAAIQELMRWFKDTGAQIGTEIRADIHVEANEAALDDVPRRQIKSI